MINDRKKELQELQIKLRDDPTNDEIKSEMEALKEEITFFEEKLKP